MQEPKDLDQVTVVTTADSENYEMTSSAPIAGHVQRVQARADVIADFSPGDRRTGCQGLQGPRQDPGIHSGLCRAELLGCPTYDLLKIGLRGHRDTDRPRAGPLPHSERFREIA